MTHRRSAEAGVWLCDVRLLNYTEACNGGYWTGLGLGQ